MFYISSDLWKFIKLVDTIYRLLLYKLSKRINVLWIDKSGFVCSLPSVWLLIDDLLYRFIFVLKVLNIVLLGCCNGPKIPRPLSNFLLY